VGFWTPEKYITFKYDSSGVEQWVATYNGHGAPSAMAVNDQGNIYVAGSTNTGGGYHYPTWSVFTTIKYSQTTTGLEQEILSAPVKYKLKQNHPNPFNPSTKIKFTLPKSEHAKIEVYNIIGQKIQTLLNKSMPAGYHEVEFNGLNLSSGVYLYRIEAGEWQDVKKMILLK
jgi:hypothetical protein